jgi:hypothetical protein
MPALFSYQLFLTAFLFLFAAFWPQFHDNRLTRSASFEVAIFNPVHSENLMFLSFCCFLAAIPRQQANPKRKRGNYSEQSILFLIPR